MQDLISKINKFTADFFKKSINLETNDIDTNIKYIYSTIIKLIIIIEESGVSISKSQISILLKNFQYDFIILNTKLEIKDNNFYRYSLELEYEVKDGRIYIYILDDLLNQTLVEAKNNLLDMETYYNYMSLQDIKLFLLLTLINANVNSINDLLSLLEPICRYKVFKIDYRLLMDFNNNPRIIDFINLLYTNINLDTEFIYTINDKIYFISIQEE